MQLFCKYGVVPTDPGKGYVLTIHDDGQDIDITDYPGCLQVPYWGTLTALGRYGASPPVGEPDLRPYNAPGLTGEVLADAVSTECGRRIYAKISDNTQKNITAYSTKLVKNAVVLGQTLTDAQKADLALADAIFTWIGAMQVTSRTLIATGDIGYSADSKWVAWDPTNAGWSALLARF